MPKSHPVKMNFTSGELSPKMLGRIDLDQYAAGVETMTNFLPVIWGGARFRPGFRFVNEVKNSADQTRLVPFEFSREQAYAIEFGDQYVRFYRDNGTLLGFPVTVPNHSFEIDGGGGADVFASWVETASDGAITKETTSAQRGDANCKLLAGASTNTKVELTVTHGMSVGESLDIKFYTRGDGTQDGFYEVYDVDNATALQTLTATGVTATDWTQITFNTAIPTGNTQIRITFQCPNVNTNFAEFDNLQFLNLDEPYEIATPYDEATLEQLQWTQSADILYLVHPQFPPQKLLRFGDDDWDIEEIDFIGPNIVENASMDADAFWVKGTGWDIDFGVASCDGTQTGDSELSQSGVAEIGVTYSVTFTVLNYSAGNVRARCGTTLGTNRSSNGTFTEDLVCAGNLNFAIRGDLNFVDAMSKRSLAAYRKP